MPSQTDYQYMQRMMRELVPDAFEKFYNETSIKTWSSLVQDDILHAAFALMDLITAQLKVTNGSLQGLVLDVMPWMLRHVGYPSGSSAFSACRPACSL